MDIEDEIETYLEQEAEAESERQKIREQKELEALQPPPSHPFTLPISSTSVQYKIEPDGEHETSSSDNFYSKLGKLLEILHSISLNSGSTLIVLFS